METEHHLPVWFCLWEASAAAELNSRPIFLYSKSLLIESESVWKAFGIYLPAVSDSTVALFNSRCMCDGATRAHNLLVSGSRMFLCPLLKMRHVKLHSNWEFILKEVFYLFNIHQYFRHVCPTAWSQSLTHNTDQRLGTREWVSSLVLHAPNNNTQLYHVSPYNNKHWIIDTLPELFKVTFCTQWMLDLHWSDEGRWRLICIGQGLDFLLLKPLVPVCCTLPGHFLLYLIKMFICTRKMQSSLSLYLASFFFNVFLCESGEVLCLVWLLFLSFVWLINVCTTRVGLFPI